MGRGDQLSRFIAVAGIATVIASGGVHGEEPVALAEGRAKVQALARRLGAEIWICHDYREFTALKKSPAFYD